MYCLCFHTKLCKQGYGHKELGEAYSVTAAQDVSMLHNTLGVILWVRAGQAAQFPKHASAACKQGKITGKADSSDTVGSLVKAYLAKKPQVVDKILKDEEMTLKSENLFGLAKQVWEAITTHAIRNMTATYMTLPLAAIATEVGLASPEEAANHIFKCAPSF